MSTCAGRAAVQAKRVLAVAGVAAAVVAAPAAQAQGSDRWEFAGTLYGYFPSLGGKTTFPQPSGTSVTIDADKVLEDLKFVFMGSLDQTILELPAGTRHWDEPWLECAQRELREETGYRADTFISLGEVWPAPGLTDETMHIFLAQTLMPDPLPGDVDETIEVAPMLLAEVVAMAQDGRLQDAKSVVAVWRTAVYLQQH